MRWFRRVVLSRPWLAFIVMGLAFIAFGAGTLNLVYLARANVALLLEHGWQAVMDGAGQQLVELIATGYASMAAYLLFKSCEHALVDRIGGSPDTPSASSHAAAAAHTDDEDRPVAR